MRCVIPLLLVCVIGCSTGTKLADTKSETKEKTVGDLIEHFRKNGFKGEFQPAAVGMIGATEGGTYKGADFEAGIYRFPDEDTAKSLEQSRPMGRTMHRKGKLIF